MLDRRTVLGGLGAAARLLVLPACSRQPRPVEAFVLRRSADRGRFRNDWLDARYTFSFSRYRDPRWTGFHGLRVLNEDRIAPRRGFPLHPHRDMEILTYVLDGALAHRDTLGNGAIIEPGIVQQMSAGTGIRHSEVNPSRRSPTHLMQIWIQPDRTGEDPGYAERNLPPADGDFRLLASLDGRAGSIRHHADADVHSLRLKRGRTATYDLRPGRGAWLQLARGDIRLNGRTLEAGDGVGAEGPGRLTLTADADAELVLLDLA
jgi:quercetin 2,3-dioxygenase